MPDYLLREYNTKIIDAMKRRQEAIDIAQSAWAEEMAHIEMEFMVKLEQRNRMYIEGEPTRPDKEDKEETKIENNQFSNKVEHGIDEAPKLTPLAATLFRDGAGQAALSRAVDLLNRREASREETNNDHQQG